MYLLITKARGVYFTTKNTINSDIFGRLLKCNGLFVNREAMRPTYMPEILPHREKEITSLASVLVPALRQETPSNVFIYGKTGTGKTAVTKFVGKELLKKGRSTGKKVNFIYINCEVVDTQYRLLQNIANHFIDEWSERVPFTGWPTDEVYAKLKQMIEMEGGVIVIILDEVDKLKGDEALYNLSRINSDLKNAKVSIVGISNDLKFTEFLDPRVKSSLGEESMIFPPYDAGQLQDILKQRIEIALKDEVIESDVIPLCSALAAQEHGDARRALELIRVAGEIAEREGDKKIQLKHIDLANSKIERDKILDVIESEPKQFQLALLSMMNLLEKNDKVFTGDVYRNYQELCNKTHTEILTQRRVSSIISEFDMLGLINAKNISRGTYGKTREIRSAIPKQIEQQAKHILINSLSL